jgi:Ca2+-transporting ATPase
MTEARDSSPVWHALTAEEALKRLSSGLAGLDPGQAATVLEEQGPNELQAAREVTLLELALHQLRSPLIYMLIAAAALSLVAGHPIDASVIAAVVVLNTIIGVTQEFRAGKALDALRQLSAPRARVLRADDVVVVPAGEVVIGDVLILETGDRVAADARVIDSTDLQIDESALTGESDPVEKVSKPLDEAMQMADRVNMLWMSTPVTGGRGTAVVVATGMDTVIGDIAASVQEAGQDETPLQRRLARLGTLIGGAAITVAVLIFGLGMLRGFEVVEMLLFSVAAAVSAIPEGLPAVISVVLAIGVRRMAEHNAIVRRLPAVETLGSTTVVCSDKTGTITRNQMTVRRMWAAGRYYDVSGEGFDPAGEIVIAEDEPKTPEEDAPLSRLLLVGALANNAIHEHAGDGWLVEGNPTEGALLVAAAKSGLDVREAQRAHGRTSELPFSSERKLMATANDGPEGPELHVKGAPERILERCDRMLTDEGVVELTAELRESVVEAAASLADDALRVVAAAYRPLEVRADSVAEDDVESELIFLGLWGLLDPPRPEAVEAIKVAKNAGVRVVMITGDHAATATAISRRAGIVTGDERTVTGEDLDAMDDEQLRAAVDDIAVYARVSPHHKYRVVQALQASGHVVGMTGDGVNDAPALRQADIGIAMGRSGTEVAKEAADMVLADDNFATIVEAMRRGRVIFSNLRRAVFFLVTTNLGEVLTLTAALVLGMPLPLTAVMILWVNLVTDGMCTIPLGLEPSHAGVMKRGPRDPSEGVIDRLTLTRIVGLAPVIAAGTLGHFAFTLSTSSYEHARTIAFTTLVAFEWFRALSTRSQDEMIWEIGLFSNRWLLGGIGIAVVLQVIVIHWPPAQTAFQTTSLSAAEWLRCLAVASSVFFVDEAVKAMRAWYRRSKSAPVAA